MKIDIDDLPKLIAAATRVVGSRDETGCPEGKVLVDDRALDELSEALLSIDED